MKIYPGARRFANLIDHDSLMRALRTIGLYAACIISGFTIGYAYGLLIKMIFLGMVQFISPLIAFLICELAIFIGAIYMGFALARWLEDRWDEWFPIVDGKVTCAVNWMNNSFDYLRHTPEPEVLPTK